MADQKTKLYMEMQMDELKAALAGEKEDSKPKETNKSKNADVAKLYEDAAEYEKELECFEKELEIINSNKLKNIPDALREKLPDEERNYAEELKGVLIAGWAHQVEVERTHPIEQLELIKGVDFCDAAEKLTASFPEYDGDFESDVKKILLKRWENLIAIKKEHIEQEIEEIYIAGLKPSFVKRIYKEFHGITD